MTVPICEHIKPSGQRCGSPALRDKTFCYYHSGLEQCLPYGRNMFIAEKAKAAPGEWPIYEFPVPIFEDAAAIQIGFQQAIFGLVNGALSPRKTKLILSALHGARSNLKEMEKCLSACANAASRKNKKKPAPVRPKARRRELQPAG
jgi:hypothetical protein